LLLRVDCVLGGCRLSLVRMKRVSSTASELNDFVEGEGGKKTYYVSKSRLVGLISLMHVAAIYIPFVLYGLLVLLCCQVVYKMHEMGFNLRAFYQLGIIELELTRGLLFEFGWKTVAIVLGMLWYMVKSSKPIYLVDFVCFEPPDAWKVSHEQLLQIMRNQECFTEESIEFLSRMLLQSGCGPSTAWPPGILKCLTAGEKSDRTAEAARKEAETVIYDCVRNLLKKTNTNPSDIDILVVNCSLFSPTPSLCSMVVNEFGMRSDVSSYNLSGMGCSAGLISIELAQNILAARPNARALVVSTENLTQNLYHGNERGFLLQNTLFRCGGAAVLLTNRWADGYRSIFKLLHCVRTQYVSEDSFGCVYETEDELNHRGVRLSKDIVKVAGRAMEKNFTTLGPYVLPISEQLKTLFWIAVRGAQKFAKKKGLLSEDAPRINPYIPDFKRGIDHFCIHAGGRGVIDGIEKNLNLTPEHVEASRHALFTYGNTSSSSIWYEMDYIRDRMNLHAGHRVLQVAFGSGFKCNSAVWLCVNGTSGKPPTKPKYVPPTPPGITTAHNSNGHVNGSGESKKHR
jgi:predicted naringenin-chalcone synthase